MVSGHGRSKEEARDADVDGSSVGRAVNEVGDEAIEAVVCTVESDDESMAVSPSLICCEAA